MRALFLFLTLSMTCFSFLQAQTPGCNSLFFSEYVEASSNDKALEIYNPTGAPIDLAAGNYVIQVYFNGSLTPSPDPFITLSGVIPSGGVWVVAATNSSAPLQALANQLAQSSWFNGDDAIVLRQGGTSGTILDVIGQIGTDPGSQWGTGLASTQDNTIRRKSTINIGDTNGSDAFDPAGEWDGFAIDDLSGLGSHTSVCSAPTSCSISSIVLGNISACNNNSTPLSTTDDFFTANVTVNYTSPPATGTLDLGGDVLNSTSIAVGSIGVSSYTFTGVQFPADGGSIVVSATFSANAPCTLTNLNAGTAPSNCSTIPNCGALYFSEYIEGSGNNKCLEIYNPTASTIDLAAGGYKIEMYFNGASGVGLTVNLMGTIAPGDVYVVCNSGAAAEFLAQADQIGGGGWYNGDDAIALSNNDGVLDVIGQIGVDPGTNWSGGSIETSEQTLRRSSFVQKGDNNGTDAFNPALQWNSYPQNTFWGLGYHATSCRPALPFGWNPFNVGCPSGTVAHSGGTFTLSSNCYEDLSSGIDEHTLVFQEICGDGEIVTRMCGINGLGFAGLNFRETANANSKQVSLLVQNSQNAHWFTRSVTGGAMQFQSKPRLNRNWLRIVRTGDVFRGYISTNGTAWQLLFQSQIAMADCIFVGLITESNVDGATTTANFCNTDVTFYEGDDLQGINNNPVTLESQTSIGNSFEQPESTPLFGRNNGSELSIRPNPAVNELEVVIPNNLNAGAMIQIMDMNGRKLYASRIEEGANLMQLDLLSMNLSAGVYTLSIQDGATVLTKRFVKVD